MNKPLAIVTSLAFMLAAGAAFAVDEHHPEPAKPAATAKSKTAKPAPSAAQMDEMMKKMQDMHDRMTAAKTPEERQQLMNDQRKLMQDGMAMMKGTSGMGCPMMDGKGGGMMMGGDAMGKRMDMMQLMMEMMMDREAGTMPMAK
ncbi:hypothetical protein ABWL39_11345 [Chitinivorax sp. PXF-14]|uniref:hypothetical protein n=1 Tax=Chitinivorax sp. PXF-14 TaxID=3230488 RepID=UPI003467D51F